MLLYVVYGSEASLLDDLYMENDCYFVCIHNSKVKNKRQNCIYINKLKNLEKIIDETLKKQKITKIVFVGAAFKSQAALFAQTSATEVASMIEVNVSNYIKIVQILLPIMQKMKTGNFIYLSSFRSQVTARGISLYSSTKAFGEKFFEVVGKENGIFGIYSSSIRMGYFEGRMTGQLSEEKRLSIKLRAGNRRLGNGIDLVTAIKFLVENPYANGGVLDLTGGINHEY